MKKSRFSYRNTIILFLAVILTACNKPPKLAENPEIKSKFFRFYANRSNIDTLNNNFFKELHNGIIVANGFENIDEKIDIKHSDKFDEDACVFFFMHLISQIPTCRADSILYFIWATDIDQYMDDLINNKVYTYVFSIFDELSGHGKAEEPDPTLPSARNLQLLQNVQHLKECYFTSENCIIGNNSVSVPKGSLLSMLNLNPKHSKYLLTILMDKYFEYINSVADEKVKILQWDYIHDNLPNDCLGYLVSYCIDEKTYILTKLVEYPNQDYYGIQILYNGKSLNEIQRQHEDALTGIPL